MAVLEKCMQEDFMLMNWVWEGLKGASRVSGVHLDADCSLLMREDKGR